MVGDQREVLYSSSRTTVTRIMTTRGPVIRKHYRGADGETRVQGELGFLQRLAGVDGVPRLVEGSGGGSQGSLTMVDSGHMAVEAFARACSPGPDWLVGFAREAALVLARVHAARVVHRDLSPTNLLVRPDGTAPLLVDFDLSTTLAEDRPAFSHPSEIVGTLPYLSPESTGRTGRTVDARSDLYSFGAVLYLLATGRPPFEYAGVDQLELVHAHLARTPIPPAELNAGVPPVFSAIVLRLLEKEPDRRYASADGLAHDLAELATFPSVEPAAFTLGSRDFPPRLSAPSRLVGRESEIATLRGAFDAVRGGSPARGVLVGGPPGVGKSALLDQLRPMVTRSGRGWFVSGKFDQYRHDQITDAVSQCLSGLGRLLLAEPDAEVEILRGRLLEALGPNAGHLAATLPEFATLLRVAPTPWDGDPSEAAARSHRAFVQVLGALASETCPLVMVVDDLQWGSGFGLGALDAILTDDRLTGVLVVGGYRDGDVGPTHPLAAMTARWHRLGALSAALTLSSLSIVDMGEFLAEMLRMSPRVGERSGHGDRRACPGQPVRQRGTRQRPAPGGWPRPVGQRLELGRGGRTPVRRIR